MKDGKFLTLGIETSCDETAISVVADGRQVWSNIISSQIEIFKNYGGVVPEIASRHHLENINKVLEEALKVADVTLDDIDLIGVTVGPGLIGALLMGVATAKAIAFAKDIPLVGVHHLFGHISANFLEDENLEPPFLALITSGGHTEIVQVKSYTDCEILGGTRDDAVGEAYDKVARVLGLGYPGGPKIDKIAKSGNPEAVNFTRVLLEKDSYDFSFSGLKTQVLNYINTEKQAGRDVCREDVAASFQQAVMEVVVKKTMNAVNLTGALKLVMAGGVAANSKLRSMLESETEKAGIKLYCPKPILCTDNGAMIGSAAYYKYKALGEDELNMDASSNLPLERN